jgi:hypothetical protein
MFGDLVAVALILKYAIGTAMAAANSDRADRDEGELLD